MEVELVNHAPKSVLTYDLLGISPFFIHFSSYRAHKKTVHFKEEDNKNKKRPQWLTTQVRCCFFCWYDQNRKWLKSETRYKRKNPYIISIGFVFLLLFFFPLKEEKLFFTLAIFIFLEMARVVYSTFLLLLQTSWSM